jgi:hypothetical protein
MPANLVACKSLPIAKDKDASLIGSQLQRCLPRRMLPYSLLFLFSQSPFSIKHLYYKIPIILLALVWLMFPFNFDFIFCWTKI